MNGEYFGHQCGHAPLSRETQERICPTKVGSEGGKENVLDSENFHTKDIL